MLSVNPASLKCPGRSVHVYVFKSFSVWDCEQESSVKDTIRQGVRGKGRERQELMVGSAGEDMLEREGNKTG